MILTFAPPNTSAAGSARHGTSTVVGLIRPARMSHGRNPNLRGMVSIEKIHLEDGRAFEPVEFWKLYDKGEFKK